jgi:hypothetical protein
MAKLKELEENDLYECGHCGHAFTARDVRLVPSHTAPLEAEDRKVGSFVTVREGGEIFFTDELTTGDNFVACPTCERIHPFGFEMTPVGKGK